MLTTTHVGSLHEKALPGPGFEARQVWVCHKPGDAYVDRVYPYS